MAYHSLNSKHPSKETTPTTHTAIVIQIQLAFSSKSLCCERGGSSTSGSTATHSGHSVPPWSFHVPSVSSQVMISLPLSCRGTLQPRVIVCPSSSNLITDFGRVNSRHARSLKWIVRTPGVVERSRSGGLVHSKKGKKAPHFPVHSLHEIIVWFCGRLGGASHFKKTERLPESEDFSSKSAP